jgi:hypothetical protein
MSRIARVRRRHSVAIMPASRQANTSFCPADQPWSTMQVSQKSLQFASISQFTQCGRECYSGQTASGGIQSLTTHALICNGKEYSTFLGPALRG